MNEDMKGYEYHNILHYLNYLTTEEIRELINEFEKELDSREDFNKISEELKATIDRLAGKYDVNEEILNKLKMLKKGIQNLLEE